MDDLLDAIEEHCDARISLREARMIGLADCESRRAKEARNALRRQLREWISSQIGP